MYVHPLGSVWRGATPEGPEQGPRCTDGSAPLPGTLPPGNDFPLVRAPFPLL